MTVTTITVRYGPIYEGCLKSIRFFSLKHTTQWILRILFNLLQNIPFGGAHTFPSASTT